MGTYYFGALGDSEVRRLTAQVEAEQALHRGLQRDHWYLDSITFKEDK